MTKIQLVTLSTHAVQEIPVPTTLHPIGVNWLPHRNGWIIATSASHGGNLLYLDSSGHTVPLRQSRSISSGIPSPDGTKLAFTDIDASGNIWMLEPAS